MDLLYLIIGLFSLGAIIGMYLLALVLQNKQTPRFLAFVHGAFVATALGLLIYYAVEHRPQPIESIVLFVIAAVGGFTLIVRDITGRSLPKWLAVLHGLVAVTGFIFLLAYAFAG